MGSRVYVGRLSYRVQERDIERFFRGYGRITEILLKNGYAFVEFSDRRDADDAVHDMNGRTMLGERIVVQTARSRPRGRDLYRDRERFRDRSRSRSRDRRNSRDRGKRRSRTPDRKKRRHSGSESESPFNDRRRSSSLSRSPDGKKGGRKGVLDKKKREHSSSSRSLSPEALKSRDRARYPKRHDSGSERSLGPDEPNMFNITVSGFENKGKFEKRLKHMAKKFGDLALFKMRSDNTCVIGYFSRDSARKAVDKMSSKEVDGQAVQVVADEEEKPSKKDRSESREKSRSRTVSGCSASGDDLKKNGDADGKEDSEDEQKSKNGDDHYEDEVKPKNGRKRTSDERNSLDHEDEYDEEEGFEKNGDESESSNDASPEFKKKKFDSDEVDATEVDSTAAVEAE